MKWHTASTERQGRPIALFLAIGFVCITGLSAVRELYRQNQVKADMTTLQDRVAKLEDRKATVSQLLQQLQTPEVIDRDARLRLNMQRPGERVYILRGENWEKIATDPAGNAPVSMQIIPSNQHDQTQNDGFGSSLFMSQIQPQRPNV